MADKAESDELVAIPHACTPCGPAASGHEGPSCRGRSSTAKRVLVKEVNWLGDLVLSLPALGLLRGTFTGSTLAVLVRQELAGFFDGVDWIDEVIPYTVRSGVRGWADQRRIIAELHSRHFDLAVIFPNSFRSALWPMLARIPQRAGYATVGRRLLLTSHTIAKESAKQNHQRWYWLGMVSETLGISSAIADTASYRLAASAQTLARVQQWLGSHRRKPAAPLIAIASAAAYGPAKEWPPSYFARLIDLLDESNGAESILLGAPSERSKCDAVARMSRAGALVAAGHTDVGELKALLSMCDGFAGNDSGAMHLAAALDIPTVGIFGSTNPTRTAPVGPRTAVIYHAVPCSPCLQRTCRFGHYQCLQSITPAEVAAALTRLGALDAR